MKSENRRFAGYIILWLLGFLTLINCGGTAPEKPPGQRQPPAENRIVIFHINDVHGNIARFSRIASIIEKEKKKSPAVFFLSAGDNFSGNPYVDRYDPRGEPVLQLLNQVGCDVQALGNHEFDYGQEVLADYMARARFPVISANLTIESGTMPQPAPYVVLKTPGGIRIAVLGLLQISGVTGIPDCNPDLVRGIRFGNEIETALQYRNLKKKNDLFIALTHLGYEKDKRLAREMGELDVIIGGHSHTIIDQPGETNGVLIVQTGSKCKYLGKIELVLRDGRLVKKTARLIDLENSTEKDSRVQQMIDHYLDNPVLDRMVARFENTLDDKREIGNLVTDAIRLTMKLDMAFYNSGGIRIHFLGKTVRLKDVYALEPFNNEVIVFEMFPSEIRSLIRFDYEHIAPLDLQASGIHYTVLAQPGGKVVSVEVKTPDGEPLREDRCYRVGMNNYMASSYKFEHRNPGVSSHRKIVDVMIQYLQELAGVLPVKNDVRAVKKMVKAEY